ncbi:hypothetical protein SS50377_28169 [Spironucleus salmonicida]|nr:hypothetical protein SS50377_28169 [Spironucleus salmonicida]|eukprot:EST47670.1 hypothetical protein SS50377_12256 [Spironucleus salmonicida]
MSFQPTLLLPPLLPPASCSAEINKLLDQTHYYFQQRSFQEARTRLYEAYALFQERDALFDYYKCYFHTMNGYLLFLMVQYDAYAELTPDPAKFLQLAMVSLIDAIDISQNLQTADRAVPRFYIGFLYFSLHKFGLALRFFRQAETLALSAEGASSAISTMASYDVAVCALRGLQSGLSVKYGEQRMAYQKENLVVVQPETMRLDNPRFEQQTEGRFDIVDTVSQAEIERLGFVGLTRAEVPEGQLRFDFPDQMDNRKTKQHVLALNEEFRRLGAQFRRSVGESHVYTNQCQLAVAECQRLSEAATELLEYDGVLRTRPAGILTDIHDQGDYVSRALDQFGAKFAKIPKRALYVEVKSGKKKGKKGKK